MSEDSLLEKIHGKVCAIDERTTIHSEQLGKLQSRVGELRERTAAQDADIKNLKGIGKRAGGISGAATGSLVTVAWSAIKSAMGMDPA